MLLECFFLLCFFLSPTPLFIFFFFTVPSLSSEQKQRKRDKNQLGFVVVNLWQCIHLCNQTLIWLKEKDVSNCVETKSVMEQIEFAFEKFLEKKTHLYETTPQPPG